VRALRVITGTGDLLDLPTAAQRSTPVLRALESIVHGGLATIRTEFGRFGRQVSGYALENLLPERGFDVTRFLVGTEGTLAVTTEATVRLVSDPPHRTMIALGYPDIAAAGDDVPTVLSYQPSACEGIDSRIVDVVRQRRGAAAVPPLPDGAAWMFVEVTGDSPTHVRHNATQLAADSSAVDSTIIGDPREAARLWRIREDGAGLSGRSPAGLPAWAGWEDAAVPPAKLGAYLRDFEALMADFGVTGLPYGHFGDGCLHIRLDYPLAKDGERSVFREFLLAASHLVASYGGSLSGEHGDGRARSELLPIMYSPAALSLFGAVEAAFDPDNLLNPGVIVDPRPVDADLRIPTPRRTNLAFAYHDDGGDFAQAVHRCTGVGKCRADNTSTGGVMCPSYLATKEEKDSTRGRARVLQEMINGATVTRGWRSPELLDTLDLCLSCKGCASDCPTGVDMATYKSEVLYHRYRHRPRPMSHYSLGWLPRWARIASNAPRLANAAMHIPGVPRAALAVAGVDHRRHLPPFAGETFRHWFARTAVVRPQTGSPVVVFVDTFTDYFTPQVGMATVTVLEHAGFRPVITSGPQCCGLTWISTGQLDTARKKLSRTISELADTADAGTPIVGMEPSCTAALRSDAAELLQTDPADAVAARVRTLAELLTDAGWAPPPLAGRSIIVQPHCHHHAVMGFDTDVRLLESSDATVRRLGGCCGLAGNFGVEKGHYEVSVGVAGQQLLPAVSTAPADATILADGYSCRTQLADLTDRRGQHLAELFAEHLDDGQRPSSSSSR
jgi:Fe-S oxidoreductase/FAD/FMN-containing dehydrogenase